AKKSKNTNLIVHPVTDDRFGLAVKSRENTYCLSRSYSEIATQKLNSKFKVTNSPSNKAIILEFIS
ncbi:MAG: hypothetical protein AAFW67_07260, partial [Cyanobacteria bacterium J06638_38]